MAPRRPGPAGSLSARLATTTLSPALRRVAELLLVDPEAIAFGTVSSVAAVARTSGPTVVRLAHALGYPGFAALRDAARAELSVRLNTDAVRVRAEPQAEPIAALLDVERSNLEQTLEGLDEKVLDAVVELLADEGRHVWVLPSTQTQGVALRFADQLMILRDGVTLLEGTELRVASRLRALRRGDVLVSTDIPRHELAMVRVQREAVARGGTPIVISGGAPVALDLRRGHLLSFACATVGPFESLVGLTALCTLLVNGIATRQPRAARRVGDLERSWTTTGLLGSPSEGEVRSASDGA